MKLLPLAHLLVAASAFPMQWGSSDSVQISTPVDFSEERLIKLSPHDYKVVTEAEKLRLKRRNTKFIDVTNQISIEQAKENGLLIDRPWYQEWAYYLLGYPQVTLNVEIPLYNYPKKAHYSDAVHDLFKKVDLDLVHSNLAKFSSFYTRYYKSESGVESATWLFDKITTIVQPVNDKVTVTKIEHNGWNQFSIVVSIPGESTDKVVVGAHQDSINLLFPNLLKAPGADDDGSGTVTTLEALRIIIDAYALGDFKPYNTLEFHYYSAEEGGLLGSADVFARYSAANATVVSMLQQDMTGSTERTLAAGVEPHFGLISDHTNQNLNEFLKVVISTYNKIPYHETECGYACSDHASALENGYPSSFLIESEFKYSSNHIHSVEDTIDRLDFDHIHEHIKLTIGYVYELAKADKLH